MMMMKKKMISTERVMIMKITKDTNDNRIDSKINDNVDNSINNHRLSKCNHGNNKVNYKF